MKKKEIIIIPEPELERVFDCLQRNVEFHMSRDKMKSISYLAPQVIPSALTVETLKALEIIEHALKK